MHGLILIVRVANSASKLDWLKGVQIVEALESMLGFKYLI